MQIANIQNNNIPKTNFKGIYLIQLPRKSFSDPKNYKACADLFIKSINKATNKRSLKFLNIFKPKLEQNKLLSCMENPSYINARKVLEYLNGEYSISELSQKTGLPIKKPIENKYHSFFVFTGEHKDKIEMFLRKPMKYLEEFAAEGAEKYPNDREMAIAYAQLKFGVAQDKEVKFLIGETPIEKFRLKDFDELKNVVKNIAL